MQFKVLAELQPAVMVRQGESALDVIGNGFTGSVRKIIERQNDNVIADADPAVFPSVSMETKIAHDSPLARFDVMDVDVITLRDIGHGVADILAIFDDRIAIANILQGKFMPQRNRIVDSQADGLVAIHNPTRQVVARCDAFHNDHTDDVALIVNQKIRCFATQSQPPK